MESGMVVVGTSWGGLHALSVLISGLPRDFPLPVTIVQHRSRDSDGLLAELLQDQTSLVVREVEDKEPIVGGHVFVAPPDYHLLVDGEHFSLSTDPLVRFSRPSIDVTFMSAADAYGSRLSGVVMTGANDDGARGLRRIAVRGGTAIVQDPATAEIRTMPEAALRMVPAAQVLPLTEIAPCLVRLAGPNGASVTPRRHV